MLKKSQEILQRYRFLTEKLSDPETIADYEARSRLMYYNCNKGMYAQFVYADGSSTFAYIPE